MKGKMKKEKLLIALKVLINLFIRTNRKLGGKLKRVAEIDGSTCSDTFRELNV